MAKRKHPTQADLDAANETIAFYKKREADAATEASMERDRQTLIRFASAIKACQLPPQVGISASFASGSRVDHLCFSIADLRSIAQIIDRFMTKI